MSKHRNVGVLGGSFDPVHNGHLRTALEVLELLNLDEIRLVPCGQPAHRPANQASAAQRSAMLEHAVSGDPRLVVDTREVERPGPSYMVDTLSSLRRELPQARLLLLQGMDSFNSLPGWHRWQELFGLAHLVVMHRPGWERHRGADLQAQWERRHSRDPARLLSTRAGTILEFELTPLAISSSYIRNLVCAGRSARYLVPDAVWTYITREQLYRNRR